MSLQIAGFELNKPQSKFSECHKSGLKMRTISSLDWSMQRCDKNKWDLSRLSMRHSRIINRTKLIGRPFTQNFQTIVVLSRIFGCHPHTITSRKIFKSTKLAKLYSSLWIFLLFTSIAYETREFTSNLKSNDNYKFYTSANVYNLAVLFSYLACCIGAIIRASNFDNGTASIREFDTFANLRKKMDPLENLVAAVLVTLTWLLIAWINCPLNELHTHPYLVLCTLIDCVFTLEVYKFCFIFGTLLRRFVQLRNIVSSRKIAIDSPEGVYYQALTVQDVFTLHHWLIDSVENFNEYYHAQIVYWFCHLVSTLIIQASVLADKFHGSHVEPRDLVHLAFTFYQLVLLCIVPHFTCKRANELGPLLFGHGAPSLKTTVSFLENLEFGFYLFKKPLKITGLGLFSVDLPLLLSIIEALVTYTTFILQLSTAADKKSSNRQIQ